MEPWGKPGETAGWTPGTWPLEPGMWRPGEFRAADPDPDGEMKVKLEEIDGEGGGCGAMVL